MKKTKLTRSLMAACSVVALTAVMYGCVHSGDSETAMDDPPPPPPAAVNLMGSTDLMPGMTTIAAGASVTVGDTTLTCSADADCVVTVMQDDVTGAFSATATGGTVTVAVAAPPPPPMMYTVDLMGSTDLMAGTTTIAAGGSLEVGPTTVTCPAGGDACVLTVSVDAVSGQMVASATGAMPTVTVAEPPEPPMEYTVDLMGSTDLMVGMTTIPAGTSVTVGQTTVECPAGGDDCALTVSEDAVTGMMTASATGAEPTVTVAPVVYAVDLPAKHSLMAGEISVEAGESVEMGGVSFTCPAGGDDCVVTVSENDDGDLVASSIGAEAMAMQVTPRGYQAFSDLSGTILDTLQLPDLQANRYHGSSAMGGSGVTSSVTTHEDPSGTNPNVTGVSDIMVTVATSATDPTRDDDNHEIVAVNTAANGTLATNPMILEAVLKDGSTAWNGDISAMAVWSNNPAAGWDTGDLLDGGAENMDNDPDDIWTHYFQYVDDGLDGGRTLELDLRSDFVPGHPRHLQEYNDQMQTIVRGAGGMYDEVTVDWDDVMFDDERYMLSLGSEVDLSTDGGVGLEGAYRATNGDFIQGRFVCVDGGAANGTPDQECEIDHQTPGQLSVSEQDVVVFLPYVHGGDNRAADSNWLAAGVWLTIPQDEENGDYAIGAFAFGNDPVQQTEANARLAEGTATYNGEAFGRYAENSDIEGGGMMVGRFTADVTLTADFGNDAGPGVTGDNNFGTIRGDVTGFMADGDARDWDVNFESATIMLQDDGMGMPVDGTALRFNGTASGHGDGGKATTGYWNGQFYGDPVFAHNDGDPLDGHAAGDIQTPWGNDLPGSAAGTFGLTSERDASDNYSLIMKGAFGAHQEGAYGAPMGN